jgi:hypothetical protein
LNTTVASIALCVNEILTSTYNAIYGGDDDELILRTAPLAATSEVQALYQAQVIDYETALPAALHSLGCTSEEIASALERRRAQEREAEQLKKAQQSTAVAELEAREHAAKHPELQHSSGASEAGSALPLTGPDDDE